MGGQPSPAGLDLVEAFERLTLDQHLHFFFENDRGERIQVEFLSKREKHWTLFLSAHREQSSRNVTRRKLPEVLEALGSNMAALESEITSHLLMQVGYCDHFIREAKELLGDHAVQQAILGTQQLMDDLTLSVRHLLGPASNTDQGAAPAPSKTERAARSKLRIIRD
jgi:hypothetical protein